MKQCEANDAGIKPLYRPWHWNRLQRDLDNENKKSSWFKTGGYEFKLFIPATENSALKRKLEEKVKDINVHKKVKFIEQTGATLAEAMRDMLAVSDKVPCDDIENCTQCKTGDIGNCRKSHILYEYDCLGDPCGMLYFGESNRNGFSRNKEHINASLVETVDGVEKSFIATHNWKYHNGENVGMKMKVLKTYRGDPTARQCAEAVKIRHTDECKLMNSKNEFHQPLDFKEKYELPNGSWAIKLRE